MNQLLKYLLLIVLVGLLASCGKDLDQKVDGRWYTTKQVSLGEEVYLKNCLQCHGIKGQGITMNWKEPLADGSYPPPPLNGTAHAWHHPLKMLKRTINRGGAPLGGKMPAFGSTLSEHEKLSVIAYFQSLWSDKIYNAWLKRGGL